MVYLISRAKSISSCRAYARLREAIFLPEIMTAFELVNDGFAVEPSTTRNPLPRLSFFKSKRPIIQAKMAIIQTGVPAVVLKTTVPCVTKAEKSPAVLFINAHNYALLGRFKSRFASLFSP